MVELSEYFEDYTLRDSETGEREAVPSDEPVSEAVLLEKAGMQTPLFELLEDWLQIDADDAEMALAYMKGHDEKFPFVVIEEDGVWRDATPASWGEDGTLSEEVDGYSVHMWTGTQWVTPYYPNDDGSFDMW